MSAATAVILVVIRMASVIFAPMLMALFLAIILLVPIRWLRSKGCPNILSLAIVIFCTAVIFFGIARLVVSSLNDFIYHFPSYKTKINQKIDVLDKKLQGLGFTISKWVTETEVQRNEVPTQTVPAQAAAQPTDEQNDHPDSKPAESQITNEKTEEDGLTITDPPPDENDEEDDGEDDETDIAEGGDSNVPPVQAASQTPAAEPDHPFDNLFPYHNPSMFETQREKQRVLTELNTESVMFWIGRIVIELRNLVASGFFVMVITIFMIFEAARFPQKIDWAFGKTGAINNRQLHDIASEIRRYLFIKSIACVMSSVSATIVYLCFGVPGAFFWGLVAFFLYFIPNIGGVVAAIIPGLLIFMAMDLEGVLLYAVILISIECAIGYGIEPKMLGHGLGISIVVIFLSLLLWGWILGPIGLFLAAPLTIMLKIVLQSFKETEWIAILLGDKYQPDKSEESSIKS